MTSRFHGVYDKINQALNQMPYDNLGISEEVKEQVIVFFLLPFSASTYLLIAICAAIYPTNRMISCEFSSRINIDPAQV